MSFLFLLGRILFGGYFIMSAIKHFTHTGMLVGYVQSKGIKQAKEAVMVGGILLLAGGLGVLLGVFVEWAVAALLLFLVPTSITMHAFWKVEDPQSKMMDEIQFMKNMALVGAALMLLSIPESWNYFSSYTY